MRARLDRTALLVSGAVVVLFVALIAIRLGPALIGQRVFFGGNAMVARPPWYDGVPVPVQNPFVSDTYDYFAPAFVESYRRFWSGDLPWWSTIAGSGTPLLASTNMGLATPLTVWLMIAPPGWALGLVKLLQLLTAFGGMTLWLRRLHVALPAALVAGLAYCGTGFFVGWSNWVPQATSAALIPALFWAIERLVQRRDATSFGLLALVVGFLLLAGFPATAGHALYAGAGYFLVRVVVLIRRRRRRGGRRPWAAGATLFAVGCGAVLTGVAIAAFQLVGLGDQLGDTSLDYRRQMFFGTQSLHSLLSTVLPTTFTNAYSQSNPIEAYAYVGVGVLVLAVIGAVFGRRAGLPAGVPLYLTIGLLLSAALVWRQGFWTNWMSDLPVFSGNGSSRLRSMVGFFACGLAGIGLQAILRGPTTSALRRRLPIVGLTVTALAAAALVACAWRYRYIDRSAQLYTDVALGLLILAAIATALIFHRRRLTVAVAVAMSTLVAGLQIIIAVGFYWPTSDESDFYPDNSLVAAAKAAAGDESVVTIGGMPGSWSQAYGVRTTTAHTFFPNEWKRYLTAIDKDVFAGPTNAGFRFDLNSPQLLSPLLDRMGAEWVMAERGQPAPGVQRTPLGDPAPKPGPDAVTMSTGAQAGPIPLRQTEIRSVDVVFVQLTDADMRLQAQVLDPAGAVIASGFISGQYGPGQWKSIPVPMTRPIPEGSSLRLVNQGSPTRLRGAGAEPTVAVTVGAGDGLRLRHVDEFGTLWQRTTALPRIRWASQVRQEPTEAAQLAALADPAFPADAITVRQPVSAPSGASADVVTQQDSGDRIQVSVQARGSGYLYIAADLSGQWRATVDGVETDIIAADSIGSAVAVPAGAHEVVLGYRGSALLPAGILSLSALLVAVSALGWGVLRRRRPVRRRSGPRHARHTEPASGELPATTET